jgi:hypothetical protein
MTTVSARTRRTTDTALDPTTEEAESPNQATPFQSASPQARRLAAAVLEVLAGIQTPSEAARAVGVSLARYYQLEQRALNGLVAACESRRRGRGSSSQATDLRRECERLRRECARQQALVRATRRGVGLAEPATPTTEGRSKKRKRQPTARALKAVALLRDEPATPTEASPAPPALSESMPAP